ncbi:MAG: NigD-like protein [Prolixibacteraceae bacterium]|jgi:hypothetical protein|nr:NigD-like protein [Prolixibacteraceae bacterium]
MKTIKIFLLITFTTLFLGSCDFNDDGYSLSDVWVGFGLTGNVSENGRSFTIHMDDGSVLYPVANQVPWFDIQEDQRLLVNFTVLGNKNVSGNNKEYYVRINQLKEVLYKGIFEITPETEDSIGNDPIHVSDAWLTGNMLTFELKYYGNSQVHYINLVKQPGELTSGNEPVELELRHNNRNDAPHIPMTAFVTFKLDAIKIEGQDSVRFKVTGIDFNNKKYEDSGVFKYGDN